MADRRSRSYHRPSWSGLWSLFQSRRRSGSSEAPLNVIQIPPPHAHRRRSGGRHFRQWTGGCWSPLNTLSRTSSQSTRRYQPQLHQHLIPAGHHHQLQLQEKPRNNLLAALASLMVICVICAAVIQPRWFSFSSGICSRRYIGLQEFMYLRPLTGQQQQQQQQNQLRLLPVSYASMENNDNHSPQEAGTASTFTANSLASAVLANAHHPSRSADSLSADQQQQQHQLFLQQHFQHSNGWKNAPNILRMMSELNEWQLNACIPAQVLSLQRLIITLCFCVLLLNLIQLMLDSVSIKNRHLDLLRRAAIFPIAGVIICVLIIALSYLISSILADDQLQRQLQRDRYAGLDDPRMSTGDESQRVEINFELSYYLISLAGLLGLVAAALNLFSRTPPPIGYETSRLTEPEAGNSLLPDPHLPSPLWAPITPIDGTPLPSVFFNPPPPPYSAWPFL